MSAPTPEIVSTDVETFQTGWAKAVLQRHDFAGGEVRYDVYANLGVDSASCDDPEALLNAAAVLGRAAHALKHAKEWVRP